jgi:hypothetical protein
MDRGHKQLSLVHRVPGPESFQAYLNGRDHLGDLDEEAVLQTICVARA